MTILQIIAVSLSSFSLGVSVANLIWLHNSRKLSRPHTLTIDDVISDKDKDIKF